MLSCVVILIRSAFLYVLHNMRRDRACTVEMYLKRLTSYEQRRQSLNERLK